MRTQTESIELFTIQINAHEPWPGETQVDAGRADETRGIAHASTAAGTASPTIPMER
ncbi:MAG TPA: hypothetical protein VFG14_13035 [Chthoniobacteraceae bacterium]|nr:hypothetical protein [Chthoniobacteraceae bacterium]